MPKINFTPFPKLETARLCLRQITDHDLPEFFILKSDERLLANYNAKGKTFAESAQKLQKLNNDIATNQSIIWGITLKKEQQLIGSICFWNITPEQRKAEIGYELMVDWQGKGIMQEALQAVSAYGFHNMGLKVIEALPNSKHEKSIRLLERNNFTRGGSITEIDPADGKILEWVIFSLYSVFEGFPRLRSGGD